MGKGNGQNRPVYYCPADNIIVSLDDIIARGQYYRISGLYYRPVNNNIVSLDDIIVMWTILSYHWTILSSGTIIHWAILPPVKLWGGGLG